MRASLGELNDSFDIVVVGAGVHGAFAALDAARRGLRVALVEQGDFGAGTSANSLRIAHGGLRYLGRGDLRRMRESIRERAMLMRLAPHLLRPLPCALPLSRPALRSAYAAVLRVNDVAAARIGGQPRLPRSRTLGIAEMHALAGREWWGDSTAAALWHDALIASPERLVIMLVREAIAYGARARNYTRAASVLTDSRSRAHGVAVVSDEGSAEVRARVVLDATGRAGAELLGTAQPCAWAEGWNAVLSRPAQRVAVAIPFPVEGRALFAVPWRGRTVLGTGYAPARDADAMPAPRLDQVGPLRERARTLIGAANRGRPELSISEDEVTLVQAGVLPMARDRGAAGVELLDKPLLIDHEARGGPGGVVTMIGVKWTTARAVAERAITLCERLAFGRARGSLPPAAPLCGEHAESGRGVGDEIRALYGPLAGEIAALCAANARLAEPVDERSASGAAAGIIGAQVVHAVRKEGAVQLEDVLMRRTDAATAGWPGEALVRGAARLMAEEKGWSDERVRSEIGRVSAIFGRKMSL